MGHASLERARPAFSGLCTFVSRIYTGETIIKWHQRNKFRNKTLSLSGSILFLEEDRADDQRQRARLL